MKTVYKLFIALFAALIVLWALNPSMKQFKEYANDFTSTHRKVVYKRIKNYLVYSVYEKQVVTIEDGEYVPHPPTRYKGFCMNFKEIK